MSNRAVTEAGPEDTGSLLPMLLAIALAILLWMAADECRTRLADVRSQVELAERAAARSGAADQARRLEATVGKAQAQRAVLMDQLRTDESAQIIRAKALYDLRRACEASGAAVCSVRLADDTLVSGPATRRPAEPGRNATAGNPSETMATLDELGVQKSRAIITGGFQSDEIVTLATRLNSDPTARWRINGLTVRGTNFELDVERHMISPQAPREAR